MTDNISYLIIAHGALAGEMLNSLEFIAGPQPSFKAIAVDHGLDVDRARSLVLEAIREVDEGDGVIVFTDLFGGTPSNIALSCTDEARIEIVAGVNMPMLLRAATTIREETRTLREKAACLRDYGKSNIFVASEVLSGKKGP